MRFDYRVCCSLLEAGRIGRIEFGALEALGSIDPKALDERYFGPRLQEVGIGISRVKQKRHAMMEERLTDYWRVT